VNSDTHTNTLYGKMRFLKVTASHMFRYLPPAFRRLIFCMYVSHVNTYKIYTALHNDRFLTSHVFDCTDYRFTQG